LSYTLSQESKTFLLALARESIDLKFDDEEFPARHPQDAALADARGAFVTLKKKGALRGCIGRLETSQPLWQTVASMARAAAFEDPRFPPLTRDELDDVSIEISVLTPFEPLRDRSELVVGRHGLLIENGLHRGVLLPQVAVEQGWDADTFLEQICVKASLPREAWKDPDSKLFVFSALVIA
jgi:AmmeMemoRadiSam system protein A